MVHGDPRVAHGLRQVLPLLPQSVRRGFCSTCPATAAPTAAWSATGSSAFRQRRQASGGFERACGAAGDGGRDLGVYRVDLHNSCALSRDSLIPGINDMLNGFFVDFWKLFGIKADSKRHFDFSM